MTGVSQFMALHDKKNLVARGKGKREEAKWEEENHNPPKFIRISRNSVCRRIKWKLFIVNFSGTYCQNLIYHHVTLEEVCLGNGIENNI